MIMPPEDSGNPSEPRSERPGCLFALLRLLFGASRSAGRSGPSGPLPYRRRDYLFSVAEREFFEVLKRAAGGEYALFAKVRLLDLLYLPSGTSSRQSHINRVQSKHADFVLCEPRTYRPVLVIELDDSSHQRDARRARDAFFEEALQTASLPLLRIPVRPSGYNVEELRERIGAATGKVFHSDRSPNKSRAAWLPLASKSGKARPDPT